jgi:hypothetical protein
MQPAFTFQELLYLIMFAEEAVQVSTPVERIAHAAGLTWCTGWTLVMEGICIMHMCMYFCEIHVCSQV